MIVNAGYRGKVGAGAPKFTYTGQYNVRKDGVVELLTSGTIVFLEPKVIDVFMVGGGASGFSPRGGVSRKGTGAGGGGGGYSRTVRKVVVNANQSIPVTIGAGGEAKYDSGTIVAGNASGFSSLTVNGGDSLSGNGQVGGSGGSGGGGGVSSNSDYGMGGSNGGNGEEGYYNGSYQGGKGQGFTTREFGEAKGKLYAGGGGGGRFMVSSTPVVSLGGAGGGGSGGWVNDTTVRQAAGAGGANTGGGGGGGAYDKVAYHIAGGAGGSGIVCFRNAQELPELAGTWKFNERIYPPEIPFDIAAN